MKKHQLESICRAAVLPFRVDCTHRSTLCKFEGISFKAGCKVAFAQVPERYLDDKT